MHKPLKVVGRDGATAVESTFSGSIGNLIPGGKGEDDASTDTAAQTTKARNQTTPTLSQSTMSPLSSSTSSSASDQSAAYTLLEKLGTGSFGTVWKA